MNDLHQDVALLRFATAGSVDDGKSTLIGRLLYDAKGLFEDQLADLASDFDLAKLTDGLRAEREQGITIDVAHRYFATSRRRFMIADCPGHAQYTRNALTGMTEADVVVLLVDVQSGLQKQTRRHAQLAALLGLPVIVCVNKMDRVGYSEAEFRAVEHQLRGALEVLRLPFLHVLPVSALTGAHVASRSSKLAWFDGPALLELLETIAPLQTEDRGGKLFVQYVLRLPEGGRRYAGQIGSGQLAVGDEVAILPRGHRARVRSLHIFDEAVTEAIAPASVAVTLDDELDVSRGDLIAVSGSEPQVSRRFEATMAWMAERPLSAGDRILVQLGSQVERGIVRQIDARLDLEGFVPEPADRLEMNDVGHVRIETLSPLPVEDLSERSRSRRMPSVTERFVVIDPDTKETLSAGLVGVR